MAELDERVRQYISGLSDEELITYIVTGIDAYEPEAVDFAREEFQRRELDPAVASKLTNEAVSRVQADRETRAEAAGRPLDLLTLILAFLAGFSIIYIVLLSRRDMKFLNAGEDRKSAQMWKAAFIGLVVMIATVIVVMYCR